MPIELEAGGVVFFCYGTAHCTGANDTDRERAGIAFHFLRTDYIPAEAHFLRTHLSGPETTGGEKEYGVQVAGTWDREVDRILAQA